MWLKWLGMVAMGLMISVAGSELAWDVYPDQSYTATHNINIAIGLERPDAEHRLLVAGK